MPPTTSTARTTPRRFRYHFERRKARQHHRIPRNRYHSARAVVIVSVRWCPQRALTPRTGHAIRRNGRKPNGPRYSHALLSAIMWVPFE
jgi:hypothetical protein